MTAKRTRSQPKASTSVTVTFDELEYKTLRLYIRDAEAAIASAQMAVRAALHARDEYLRTLAEKYQSFDASTIDQLQWNDETREFRFTPQTHKSRPGTQTA